MPIVTNMKELAGSIVAYAGPTTSISGYLLCNGATVNIADFKELYAQLGTTYGGDGVTTFAIPDLRGEFLRGLDNGRGVDSGRSLSTSQADATSSPSTSFTGTISGTAGYAGAHTHHIYSNYNGNGSDSGTDAIPITYANHNTAYAIYTNNGVATGAHAHSVTGTASVTGGGDAETRPRNNAVNYFIKY